MGYLYNRHSEEDKRRVLRRNAPPAEVLFWQRVRDRQLGGFKFRRQWSIGPYVADFCCPECRVIVELDGPSLEGEEAAKYDAGRQHYFESLGFQVVRFPNEQIYHQMPMVLKNLLHVCASRKK